MQRFTLFVLLLVLATACRPSDVTDGSAAATAAAASETRVRIEPDTEPALGNVPITVYLLKNGEGISGAEVEITGDMTHAGMVPVIAQAAETEPGLYRAEDFAFTMAGDWVLTADITMPDGRSLSNEIKVTVPGE